MMVRSTRTTQGEPIIYTNEDLEWWSIALNHRKALEVTRQLHGFTDYDLPIHWTAV